MKTRLVGAKLRHALKLTMNYFKDVDGEFLQTFRGCLGVNMGGGPIWGTVYVVGPKRLLHIEIGVDRAAVERGQPRAMTSGKYAF